jgi:urease accessory protein
MYTEAERPQTTADRLLGALALGDSALPIGRFVHSGGLEAWLGEQPNVGSERLRELIRAMICEGAAPLDAAVLAHAHRALRLERLIELDRLLTARKLTPASRQASHGCGRQLAALAPQLVPADTLVEEASSAVRNRRTDGNLAVIEGTLARALGVPARDAVLTALRSGAAALLSAAVRLGAISPSGAQTVLIELSQSFVDAAALSAALELDELSSTIPEMEIHAMRHVHSYTKTFAT